MKTTPKQRLEYFIKQHKTEANTLSGFVTFFSGLWDILSGVSSIFINVVGLTGLGIKVIGGIFKGMYIIGVKGWQNTIMYFDQQDLNNNLYDKLNGIGSKIIKDGLEKYKKDLTELYEENNGIVDPSELREISERFKEQLSEELKESLEEIGIIGLGSKVDDFIEEYFKKNREFIKSIEGGAKTIFTNKKISEKQKLDMFLNMSTTEAKALVKKDSNKMGTYRRLSKNSNSRYDFFN